ncbi:MAG: glycosyltransferase [Verrucomicrobiota bacterium]
MKKLKILHYIPVYAPAWEFGGPVRSVSTLCESLARLGHEVTVFTTNAGLGNSVPLNQSVMRNGVQVTYFQREQGYGIKSRDMECVVRQNLKHFDILHITGVWQRTSLTARRAAQKENIPFVISPRGALGSYSWTQKRFKKILYYLFVEQFNIRYASGIHYTSQMESEECKKFQTPHQKSCVISNSLDFSQWQRSSEQRNAMRQKLRLGDHEMLFLNVGRLHHKKGLDFLPEVLADFKDQSWHLAFVGPDDDGTGARLKKNFSKKQLLPKISFFEQADHTQLQAFYSAADWFVLPSLHENFGNVILEALACECPCAITPHVGLHQELANLSAVRVIPHSVDEWKTFFARALTETPPSAPPRAWLEERFHADKIAKRMSDFYHHTLSSS